MKLLEYTILWSWRSALVLLALFIVTGATKNRLALSGEWQTIQRAGAQSAHFSSLLPHDRVLGRLTDQEGDYREIIDEPVYFDLKLPRSFDQLELELTYQNDLVPRVGLGVKVGENQFDLKSVENQNIDYLLADVNIWQQQQDGELLFLQRRSLPQKYNTVEDFLKSLDDHSRAAAYNYDLKPYFRIKDYQSKRGETIIDSAIRGPHRVLTYLKDEPLRFAVKIQDINRRSGPDPFEIIIYRNQEPIYVERLEDDGLVSQFDPASGPRSVTVDLKNLEEGVYLIEFRTSEDIFIREVRTSLSKWVYLNRLYLADNSEYHDGFPDLRTDGTLVYTNAPRLNVFTAHQEGLQKIKIENQELEINQTHRQFVFRRSLSFKPEDESIYQLFSPNNDLQLEGSGLFAFAKEHFFNPNYTSLDAGFTEWEEVDYVIARYIPPAVVKGLKMARAEFDLARADRQDGKITLVISAPEVNQENRLKIYQIKVKLKGRKIGWSEIKERVLSLKFNQND